MIQTAMQLKALIHNKADGDSIKAQTLLRNYMMERFLERCSISKYRNHFILKGGMLVASCVGADMRATMDIDATVQTLSLKLDSATKMIQEIIEISLEDGVTFRIVSATDIMAEHDYPGLRFMLEGFLDRMRIPFKIDISTGDAITPRAIEYSYHLMFENRDISVLAYNLETVLGEKMETVLTRAEANTRMRDFYDIHVLLTEKQGNIREDILQKAFTETCKMRKSINIVYEASDIINSVMNNESLIKQWENYRKNSFYVGELDWPEVIDSLWKLAEMLCIVHN